MYKYLYIQIIYEKTEDDVSKYITWFKFFTRAWFKLFEAVKIHNILNMLNAKNT